MKKYSVLFFIGMSTVLLSSCNGHFRFLISPLPPAPISVRIASPGVGYIWIDGEWYWNGRTYIWRDGYWALPVNGNSWTPGYWRRRGDGWFWMPGRWRTGHGHH